MPYKGPVQYECRKCSKEQIDIHIAISEVKCPNCGIVKLSDSVKEYLKYLLG